MPEIAPHRIKAFLDDLALVCAKHQLALFDVGDGISVEEMRGSFTGLALDTEGWLTTRGGDEYWVQSLDISAVTAHQRIALERSLARPAA